MGVAPASWAADQESRFFRSLQLTTGTCVRQPAVGDDRGDELDPE
jgi:hypothetical protein